jgi:hypothetical protein
VTINTVPSAPTMSGPSTACNSASISAAPGSGGDGIRWDNSSTTQGRTVTSTGNYTAVTTSSAGCESGSAGVNVTIYMPGTDGQSSSPCGCESASADCGGLCTAKGTYTVNTEECVPNTATAYVAQVDQCGNVVDPHYATYAKPTCYNCTGNEQSVDVYHSFSVSTEECAQKCSEYCDGIHYPMCWYLKVGCMVEVCQCMCQTCSTCPPKKARSC